ncbi:MAG: serine hydrolase [Planctomycetes bacterium]|nr:serine hydrolase [Planctomycetota bacterium]
MRIVSLLAVLVLTAPASAQPPLDPGPSSKYLKVIPALNELVQSETMDKKIPSLSLAIVADQDVIFMINRGPGKVYRVGSVSKLFTDVAIMQLVEEGKLDLDAPVAKYVPEFKPAYKEGQKQITLRMLMAHRSGLIREPPVGNYFDPTEPSLEKSVLSLNGIEPIYDPGSRTKYSNAAVGLVGYVIQKTQNEKFETFVQRRVLDRIGMESSSFTLTPALKKKLPEAVMWTYHGREFPAPTFSLGVAPAGCMYSDLRDLAKFELCLFAGGKVGDKQLLKPETIEEMFRPQFAKDGSRGFGLGFIVGELEGKKRIGHGGAIYGFSTELAMLPSEKLGVIVMSARDVSNGMTTRIADDALRLMLAAKEGKPLPKLETTEAIPATEATAVAGRYRDGEKFLDLNDSFGKLTVQAGHGGPLLRLRKLGKDLMVDDVQGWGPRITVDGDKLTVGKNTYTKEKPSSTPPAEAPAKWKGLIGEYGWDHNTLYIYERDGKLHALIEWTEIDPLTEESENVFAFPADRGMYHGEKLVFTRDKDGRATKVTAASVVFERRKIDGEGGETFQIKPVKPLDELRKLALAATPPGEKGEFLKPDLVDLATIDGIKFDIRYATDNNFLGKPFYTSAKAFMQKPAAAALARVQKTLKERGYGLFVYDAYRPWYVTKMFWDATPEKFHNFVADPSKGSRHNRGCAVDLGLYDLKTGKVIEMVSGYDEMTDRAFPDYMGTTSRQRWHRDLLRRAMEAEGYSVYEEEWWHYDYKDWRAYPILNKTFEELMGK